LRNGILGGAVVLVIVLVVLLLLPDKKDTDLAEPLEEFDAFAGGYPVPPPLGTALPELAGVVAGSVADPGAGQTDQTQWAPTEAKEDSDGNS
jgi:NADH-quinone oxidoreductase subunit H